MFVGGNFICGKCITFEGLLHLKLQDFFVFVVYYIIGQSLHWQALVPVKIWSANWHKL